MTSCLVVREAVKGYYTTEQARQASALSSISLAAVTSYFSSNSGKEEEKAGGMTHGSPSVTLSPSCSQQPLETHELVFIYFPE